MHYSMLGLLPTNCNIVQYIFAVMSFVDTDVDLWSESVDRRGFKISVSAYPWCDAHGNERK